MITPHLNILLFSLLTTILSTASLDSDGSGGQSRADRMFFPDIAGLEQIDCTGNTLDIYFDSFGAGPENPRPFDPGFSPVYTYRQEAPLNTGEYSIVNSTIGFSGQGENWLEVSDQDGNPESYFAVFNASDNPGTFWEQLVNICPGGNVEIEMSIARVVGEGQPSHIS